MKFWKEHAALRVALIAGFFVVGLVLVFVGWGMKGQMSGLLIMVVGLVLLLGALAVYNKPFETPREPRKKKAE